MVTWRPEGRRTHLPYGDGANLDRSGPGLPGPAGLVNRANARGVERAQAPRGGLGQIPGDAAHVGAAVDHRRGDEAPVAVEGDLGPALAASCERRRPCRASASARRPCGCRRSRGRTRWRCGPIISPSSAGRVCGPTTPSAVRPCLRWKLITAASVAASKLPDSTTGPNSLALRIRCRLATAGPLEPSLELDPAELAAERVGAADVGRLGAGHGGAAGGRSVRGRGSQQDQEDAEQERPCGDPIGARSARAIHCWLAFYAAAWLAQDDGKSFGPTRSSLSGAYGVS